MFLEFLPVSAISSMFQKSLKNFLSFSSVRRFNRLSEFCPVIASAIKTIMLFLYTVIGTMIWDVLRWHFYDSTLESLPIFEIRFKSTYQKYVLYTRRAHTLWSVLFLFRKLHLVFHLCYPDLQDTVLFLDWFS